MDNFKLLIQNAVLDPSFKKNVQSRLNNIRGLSIKTDAVQLTGLRESIPKQVQDIKMGSISLPAIDDSAFRISLENTNTVIRQQLYYIEMLNKSQLSAGISNAFKNTGLPKNDAAKIDNTLNLSSQMDGLSKLSDMLDKINEKMSNLNTPGNLYGYAL